MTRRTTGPKRRAERYARTHLIGPAGVDAQLEVRDVWALMAISYMAGYSSAARKRRIVRPKPRK